MRQVSEEATNILIAATREPSILEITSLFELRLADDNIMRFSDISSDVTRTIDGEELTFVSGVPLVQSIGTPRKTDSADGQSEFAMNFFDPDGSLYAAFGDNYLGKPLTIWIQINNLDIIQIAHVLCKRIGSMLPLDGSVPSVSVQFAGRFNFVIGENPMLMSENWIKQFDPTDDTFKFATADRKVTWGAVSQQSQLSVSQLTRYYGRKTGGI